jgi:RNA polymerase sigma factor (sigma-70 family)
MMETRITMPSLAEMLAKARRAVLRRGVSEEDAEELVHDAFLRIEKYERTQEARSREALLVTAAVNLSIDRGRRRQRSPFVEIDDLHAIADAMPDPAQIVEQQERLHRAAEGLAQLPERTRRILLKRRLDGLAYAEIAASEGMSVAAVEKQVARATLQLMQWMAEW